MSDRKNYSEWVRQRRGVEVSPEFAERVMHRILTQEPARVVGRSRGDAAVAWVASRRLAQAAAIVLATGLTLLQGVILLRIGIG